MSVVPITADEAVRYDVSGTWPCCSDTGASCMPEEGFEGNIGKVELGDTII
jgi:hypothetical protein